MSASSTIAIPTQLAAFGSATRLPRTGRALCWIGDHNQQSDIWLASDVALRCEQAIETIYHRHAVTVLRLARRITCEARYAEEVAQEVFATLWRQPEKFDSDRGSLRNWLLTLTHRRSIDLVRVERRFIPSPPDSPVMVQLSTDAPIDVQVCDRVADEQVRVALQALPDRLREVLVLAYFDGRTQQEIAAVTGIPLGTVKTRTRSALRSLQISLGAL